MFIQFIDIFLQKVWHFKNSGWLVGAQKATDVNIPEQIHFELWENKLNISATIKQMKTHAQTIMAVTLQLFFFFPVILHQII